MVVGCDSILKKNRIKIREIAKVSTHDSKSDSIKSIYFTTEATTKPRVNVVVIVSSAPSHFQRRDAIRRTWWSQCRTTDDVTPVCMFVTDDVGADDENYERLRDERSRYSDVRFQQGVPSGVAFGLRYLNHMVSGIQFFFEITFLYEHQGSKIIETNYEQFQP